MPSFGESGAQYVILLTFCRFTYFYEDTNRRAVWLGRHPSEKISEGPNDKLIQVGNLEWSVSAKACLTVLQKARKAELKDGTSEPQQIFNGSLLWQKRYPKDNWVVSPDSSY